VLAPLWARAGQPLPILSAIEAGQGQVLNKALPTPLKTFLELIGSIRSATPQSAVAKAKAVRVFTELYETGYSEVQEILGHMVQELAHLLKNRPFLLPKTKEHLILMVLHVSQDHLQTALKKQPATGIKPSELSEAIYTALNQTFGDFWRKVFLGIGITAGIGFVYYIYRKCSSTSPPTTTVGKVVDMLYSMGPERREALVDFLTQKTKPSPPSAPKEKSSTDRILDVLADAYTAGHKQRVLSIAESWGTHLANKARLSKLGGHTP